MRTTKRLSKHRGNGVVPDAQHDADVIRMVSAELHERAAALHAMVAEAAYFRAEKRGFQVGHELEDWLAAEDEIAQRLQAQETPARVAEARSES